MSEQTKQPKKEAGKTAEKTEVTKMTKAANEFDVAVANVKLDIERLKADVERKKAESDLEYLKFKAETESGDTRRQQTMDLVKVIAVSGMALAGFMYKTAFQADVEKHKIDFGKE